MAESGMGQNLAWFLVSMEEEEGFVSFGVNILLSHNIIRENFIA